MIQVKARRVCCSGNQNDQDLGHPKIYLELGKEEEKITCPYCGEEFIYVDNSTQ
ncbi:MAG: zinc-finger domain-containing protein [Wolbachia endosymbiont of Fragariocoptes setiger]|nr:zinc-finger domain-containing protein [Wolbachia endosymbiont of Fragariocoptes setiger]